MPSDNDNQNDNDNDNRETQGAAQQEVASEAAAAQDLRQQLAAQHLETPDEYSNTNASNNSRKRDLDDMLGNDNDILRYGSDGRVLDLPRPVRRLRLEAIFHPKFENESQTDKDIRRKMRQAIQAKQGYLEVSLKHSGSLLLWSGGRRFYSKNSTDNVFTHVGEILLKQHFVRAYWNESQDNHDDNDDTNNINKRLLAKFDECSAYVQQHRLTLSFEAVSAVTGDHGDRPRRDFLILTAVADRNQQRFWGTDEIVALAQRFRLPHNDAWIFKSQTSVQKLFEFYDAARESSYASQVVTAMSQAADTRLESMLPHVDFQGDILEGIVIRFVACAADSTLLDTMQTLAQQSRQTASLVPPSHPDAWELLRARKDATDVDSLLTVNLRELYQATKFGKREGPSSFAAAVAKVMDASSVRRRVQKVPKAAADLDMPSWTRDLRHANQDPESQRIAKLVELLGDINVRVDYGLLREHTPGQQDRWLCIIHVLHDFSFQKYRKHMKPDDMPLFRGFSIEINGKENESNEESAVMEVDTPPQSQENLMLKMKFLPYMVRTFGCRNGLNSLRQGGVEAFVKYTNNLLSKWGISVDGRLKWVPFFRAWAEYALPRMETTMPGESDLRLLTGDNYLEHLERFEALYKTGEIRAASGAAASSGPTSRNQGLVIVVSPRQETAKSVADLVAKALDNARRMNDINAISKQEMEALCLRGQGVVCSAKLNDGVSNVRRLMGEFGKFISIIIVGCSDEDIQSDLNLAQDIKMYRGLANAWRKTRAVMVLELPPSAVFAQSDDDETPKAEATSLFHSEMEKIKLVFQAEGPSGPQPGMLVFFPAIPGSGKSSVACEEAEQQIREELSKQAKDRKLILRMGDKTKGKFWPIVKGERKKNGSSLYIADKNVPSTSWGLVASICADTKAMGLPIFPDDTALQTTVIKGIREPDGSLDPERRHMYPFSLHYLAVCLHRVMSRPPKSHPGKLDSSLPRACMIVVKFYCLYRRTTAEEFRENLLHQFQQSGAVMGTPIEVPFFAKRTPDSLPADLEGVLTEALQAYYGYDVAKGDPIKDSDTYVSDLETRLRQSLKSHASFIKGLTVDVSESRKVFVSKFIQRVAELDSIESWTDAEAGTKSSFIHLASIDVNVNDAQSLLVSLCEESEELASLTRQLVGEVSPASVLTGDSCQDRRFIFNTHVTLAHFKENPQNEMRSMIGSIIGELVDMRVVAILWDDRVAAIEVELPENTTVGSVLPRPKKDFAHITVWCEQGASAFMSNELPSRVQECQAQRVALAKPVSLLGELSFWTG